MANRYTGKRKGCIYTEVTNAGHRYARGAGCVDRFFKSRFVASFCYYGKRYRFRSTSYVNCCLWLEDMRAKYND